MQCMSVGRHICGQSRGFGLRDNFGATHSNEEGDGSGKGEFSALIEVWNGDLKGVVTEVIAGVAAGKNISALLRGQNTMPDMVIGTVGVTGLRAH